MKPSIIFAGVASLALAGCSGNDAISEKVAACKANRQDAEIVDARGNIPWRTISNPTPVEDGVRFIAQNNDGRRENLTVNWKKSLCILGNPKSNGSIPFRLTNSEQPQAPSA